jgi:branched-chain amino acid transport system substrate-binding protein
VLAQPQAATPYRRAGEQPLEFRGAGRELIEPSISEVVLGWFGPDDPDHPDFGEPWRGAVLGLEAENAAGGYRGAPLRLVAAWSESPWHAGIGRLTRLVYDRQAWAVIGGMDGATTHLAEQVALKARLPLLSPGSTDPTANCAHVPWLFTALPPDDRQAKVLVVGLRRELGDGRLAVAAAVDHDSHATLVAYRRELAAQALVPQMLVEFEPAETDAGPLAARLLGAGPAAVLVIAPPRPAAALVSELRRRGFDGAVLGNASLGRNAFVRAAGPAAEGVVAPLLHERSPAWDAFVRDYQARWGGALAPDDAAVQAYDAVRYLASALRASGLNRARLADALRALAPWSGAAGELRWDALGRNQREVRLARWRGGRRVAAEPSAAAAR